MAPDNPKRQKSRIAFIGAGVGFPGEKSKGHGIPGIRILLEKLSPDFEIVIYSLIRISQEKVPRGIKIRQVSPWPLPQKIKYVMLLLRLIVDHVFKPFGVFNAISAYPAGRMAVILGKFFRKPVVVILIGSEIVKMPEIGYGDFIVPRLEKIVRRVCRESDVVVVMSEYQKKMAERNLALGRDISVFPLRIDVQKFPFCERSISLPIQFLNIGYRHPVKDQETLFRAFAIIVKSVPAYLTVIGDGFDNPTVQKLLTDLKILDRVGLVGTVQNEALTAHFAKAHVLLHTARYESGCGVAQEAMASGVPVCTTSVGILADLGDQFSVIVQPNDPQELADKTIALIHDSGRYHRLQKIAHDYIAAHDLIWAASQYRQLFESLIKGDSYR
jgi:glycosyltransferase involved in cell wall biosynthesis